MLCGYEEASIGGVDIILKLARPLGGSTSAGAFGPMLRQMTDLVFQLLFSARDFACCAFSIDSPFGRAAPRVLQHWRVGARSEPRRDP